MKIIKTKFEKFDSLTNFSYMKTIGILVILGLLVNTLFCFVFEDAFNTINPIVFIIGYLILSIGAIIMMNKTENRLILTLCYFFIVIPTGIIVSNAVSYYNLNSAIVFEALLLTTLITTCMIILGFTNQKFFLKIGNILFGSLLILIVSYLICFILNIHLSVLSWVSAFLFSIYIGYDISVAQNQAKTFKNAILSTTNIYLDIINLFMNVLEILSSNND